MQPLISICIPTYKRPELLALAIESCAMQSYSSIELIVSDDSPDDVSRDVVERFRKARDWIVTYIHNRPALGQNANVNRLFQLASADRLILLHDDDTLLPGSLEMLATPFEEHASVVLVFGKQEIIFEDGMVDKPATDKHNVSHTRTPGGQGLINNALRAALLLQIPNDGFMVETRIAREIGYRSNADVGVYCDKDFALRLGASLGPDQLFFVDRFISQYRSTRDSVSQSSASRKTEHPRAAIAMYENLPALAVPTSLSQERRHLVEHLIDKLVKGYATTGRRRTAFKLYASRTYGWRRRRSSRGLYHLALIMCPGIDRLRPYD